jgi:RNA polymerase sigma-70 factor (ECF subfamily)
VLDTSEAAARQLVHRAKSRIAEGQPRFDAPPLDRQQEIVERFFEAVQQNDVPALERMLSADVVFTSDSGGKAPAAMRPVIGADPVARLVAGLWRKGAQVASAEPTAVRTALVELNGEPALTVRMHGDLVSAFVFSTDADRIVAIRVMRNPDKLAWLDAHA